MRPEERAPERNATPDAPHPPDQPEHESVARTPQPKVLARIPRVGAASKESSNTAPTSPPPLEAEPEMDVTDQAGRRRSSRTHRGSRDTRRPRGETQRRHRAARTDTPDRDRLPGFDGRLINQRLATRILFGAVAVLLLIAIVPLAFKGDDAADDTAADSAADQPTWQADNPAPNADAAPAWQPLADGQPSANEADPAWQVGLGAGPSGSIDAPASRTAHSESGHGYSPVQRVPQPPQLGPGTQPPRDAQWARSNRGQSLPPEDLPANRSPRDNYAADNAPSEQATADWNGSGGYGVPNDSAATGYDRANAPGASSYDASPLPGPHGPADAYTGTYQAARPNPPYRQAYRPERSDYQARTAPTGYTTPADSGYSTSGRAQEQHWEPNAYDSAPTSDSGRSAPGSQQYDSGPYTPISPPPAPNPQSRYDRRPASPSPGSPGYPSYSGESGPEQATSVGPWNSRAMGYDQRAGNSYDSAPAQPAGYQAPASSGWDSSYGAPGSTGANYGSAPDAGRSAPNSPYPGGRSSYDDRRPSQRATTPVSPGPAPARFQGGIEQPADQSGYSNSGASLR